MVSTLVRNIKVQKFVEDDIFEVAVNPRSGIARAQFVEDDIFARQHIREARCARVIDALNTVSITKIKDLAYQSQILLTFIN